MSAQIESPSYAVPVALLRSPEVCDRAGITYRQLDLWSRKGVIAPVQEATGPGSRRLFSSPQVQALALLGTLASLGASTSVLGNVYALASEWPTDLWAGRIVVLADGDIYPAEGLPPGVAGWTVDLARMAPQIAEAYETGRMPTMLPEINA